MIIKLHGKFAKDYESDIEIHAETIAEAIEGWSRQVRFYEDIPLDSRPIVRVVGADAIEDFYEKTEQTEIHLVPAMIGGGGNFGKIIIGVVLIVVAIYYPPAAPYAAQIAGALFAAGVGLVLSGVMGLFMKAPSLSKSNDPDASKYLGLSNNTLAIGTPIAICYGRVPVNGQVLALNVDSSDLVMGNFPDNPV